MPMLAETLRAKLEAAFPDAAIALEDLAGDGDHYRVTITAEAFRNHTRVAQHKMVYDALGSAMGGQLHALAVITKTPDQEHP